MTKLTYAQALEVAINSVSDEAIVEKLKALKASIEKKSSAKGERKPTATQVENMGFKADILASLATVDKPVTIKELCEVCPSIAGLSNQRITHLLTDLRKNGEVAREYVKKVPYFYLGTEEVEEA